MAEILSPGVYVEEIQTAPQIVPGVTTSNMGILGYAPQGPANVATLVQSYEQYSRIFGGLVTESFMPLSLAAFFANGGRRAYVVRVPPANAVAADAKIQSHTSETLFTGDGSVATITGTVDTAAGAAPLVCGSLSVNWRKAGGAVSGSTARNSGDTAALYLTSGQASYDGRVNPSSIPALDPSLDAVVRGTATLNFTVAAAGGAKALPIPVGTGSQVSASIGNATDGAVATLDHVTGRFSLRTFGNYVPAVAAAYASKDLSTVCTNVDSVIEANVVGTPGNSIQIRFISAGSESLVVAGNQVTYNFNSGATTVADFEDAVANDPTCPFNIATPGTAGNILAAGDVIPYTNLAGGAWNDEGAVTVDFTPASATYTAQDGRGSITVVAGASLVDGETFTIDDGVNPALTFEFDSNGVATGIPIPFSGVSTDAEVQAATISAINTAPALLLKAEAVSGSTSKIRLVPNSSTAPGEVVLSETVTSGSFSVAPTVASTAGLWTGDVSGAGSVNYSSGAVSIPVTGFVPHLGANVLITYTADSWDLNPISVGAWGNRLRLQITGSPNYFTSSTGSYSRYDVVLALADSTTGNYSVLESYEELVFNDPTSAVYFADVINELSDYITVTEPAGDVAPPQLNAVPYTQVLCGGSALLGNQTVAATLAEAPVQKRTVRISFTTTAGAAKTVTDDGDGNLIGDVDSGGVNTINYTTGAVNFKASALIKGGTLVVASYCKAPEEVAHTEDFGDAAKNYTAGEEGTFDSVNWGRNQFSEVSALAASYKGLYAFNKVDELLQVVVPDFAGDLNVTGDLLAYASTRASQPSGGDRFIILTTPKGYSAEQAVSWFRFTLGQYSDYAALYWPWVKVADPLLNGRPKTMPALAHIAGVYARTDNTKNVGKSPGGTVDGALTYLTGLETNPSLGDRDIVYPNKINPLISSPQTGLAVWGVRTISNTPDWRYINARRLFMFLEKSIYNATWWTVFENNGPVLWTKITTQLNGFLSNLYAGGYFAGGSPAQAFFVICDGTNNTAQTIEAGQVIIDIGVAPNKPAEFIRLRFQQKSLNS